MELPVRTGINILRYAKVLVSMAAMEMTFPIITSWFVRGGRLQCPWKEYNEEIDADGESDDAGRHGNRGNCSDLAFVLSYNISQSTYPSKRNGDADTMA